jgi:muramoyltetrapeptide carboxypeptidase
MRMGTPGDVRIPPRLLPGGTIGIVAPASPPSDPAKLERGIDRLESLGYRVLRGATLNARMGYLSGDDDLRARDLQSMFENPDVGAIFCSRGGYGSTRVLDRLDYRAIARHPKIFVGFSDITALHMALLRKARLLTFAGPMVAAEMEKGMDDSTAGAFWPLIASPRVTARLAAQLVRRSRPVRGGRAEGVLVGGNMAVLMSLIGTPYEPRWDGAILFVEDVGENVYRIDRMFSQLRNAGILARVTGAILGGFTSIPDDTPNRELTEVLAEYLLPCGYPVLADLPFGHLVPKLTLPMGARIRLDAGRRTITLLHPVVA